MASNDPLSGAQRANKVGHIPVIRLERSRETTIRFIVLCSRESSVAVGVATQLPTVAAPEEIGRGCEFAV
jgi:hypothetical protein